MFVLRFSLDTAGETVSVRSSDLAQNLPPEILTSSTGKQPSSVNISIEIASIRYSFSIDPTTVTLGHLVHPDSILILENVESIQNFKFINASNSIPSILQITPFFK